MGWVQQRGETFQTTGRRERRERFSTILERRDGEDIGFEERRGRISGEKSESFGREERRGKRGRDNRAR